MNFQFTHLHLKILSTIALLFIAVTCYTQSNEEIKHLNLGDGLSNSSVKSIFQDHRGFIWFGSFDGLNRYDGHLIKVYRNRISDSTSLPYNYIYSIEEDAEKNIWVGTGQGLGIFNPISEKFSSAFFRQYNLGKPIKLTAAIQVIKRDRQGNMLLGTSNKGLIIKEKSAQDFKQFPYKDEKGKIRFDLNIIAITQGKGDQIWIVVDGLGLCVVDYHSKTLKFLQKMPSEVVCLAYNDGILLLGTKSGLFQYKASNDKLTIGRPELITGFIGKSISSLMIKKNKVWVGIEGGGIKIIDLTNGQRENFDPQYENESVIGSRSTVVLFMDNESRTWIGSVKRGIYFISNFKNPFRVVRSHGKSNNGLISNDVSCFAELDNKHLWVGTDGEGLSLWNRNINHFINYSHQSEQKNSLSNNNVSSIIKDHKGLTWVATYGGGINKYEQKTGTFKHYILSSTGERSNDYSWLLYEDHQHVLWVTTFSGGSIFKYNRILDKFELFDRRLANTISFFEDSKHSLWAGDYRFLTLIDKKFLKHKSYDIGKPIRAIYEDKMNNFWLGTESGGLILFDRKSGKIKAKYSDANGLCNNSVLNILEDNSGNLWLSTFFGLSKFNIIDRTFQNYFKGDGLSSDEFSYNSALKLHSGEMIFGGVDGFTIFHPDSLMLKNSHNTLPYLSLLKIDNSPVSFDKQSSFIDSLATNVLKVSYNKTLITLSISSIDFSRTGERRFMYFLEGWNEGWSSATSSTLINYSHLAQGSYKLHVKTENGINGLGEDTILLELIVLPPWYNTWWAYLSLTFIIIAVIYTYNQYRVKQADYKYETLLSLQNSQKEKEITERKIQFFTEVSHEFRTPLTLIINPLEAYLKRHSDTSHIDDLKRVHTNAQRLLGLVDQLLMFRQVGANSDSLRITKLPFDLICTSIFNSFLDQAKLKQIKYNLDLKGQPIELYADREKVEVILYNLLSNAIKFTPNGGKIMMDVINTEIQVEITLSNSGPGIPQHVGERLFEQFYQVPETNSAAGNGFGIGLYLVKHFIDRHQAEIRYESSNNTGTTFYLNFLKDMKPQIKDIINSDNAPKLTELAQVNNILRPEKTKIDRILSKQKCVLIVEDNEELLNFLASILEEDYIIYKSKSGIDAFEQTKKYLPDIIITDIMMENGNGLELCKNVKNDLALCHIPIILLTAMGDSDIRLRGIENGADEYIVKPFQTDILLARIKILLQNNSKLQDYFYNTITLKNNDFNVSSEYSEFLKKCINIINMHLFDEDFNIKKLSSEMGMSHSALYRKVKEISGESIASFIRFIRLRRSAEMMISTDLTVSEIILQVGITDQKYFRLKFNGLFGMNPSEYIKKYRHKPTKKSYLKLKKV